MDKQRTLLWYGMEVTENSRRSTLLLQVTGDVCTELKITSSNDGEERVQVGKHPHRRQINSHDAPCGNQFVSNHDIFIVGHVIIFCRIIVLAHQL